MSPVAELLVASFTHDSNACHAEAHQSNLYCVCLHVCCSPFSSRDNIYKGRISIVAVVNDPADTPATGNHIAFDVAQVDPSSSPSAASSMVQSGNRTSAANNGTAAGGAGKAPKL